MTATLWRTDEAGGKDDRCTRSARLHVDWVIAAMIMKALRKCTSISGNEAEHHAPLCDDERRAAVEPSIGHLKTNTA